MRTPFLTSAALLLALGLAAPVAADVLAMPPLSGAEKEADASDDAFVSVEDISPADETATGAEGASDDAFVTLDTLSPDSDAMPQESEATSSADDTPSPQADSSIEKETAAPPAAAPSAAGEERSDGEAKGKFQQLLTPPPEPIDTPRRGLSMDQVEQLYGRPGSVTAPVGDPPITRWDYPEYSVYFEYSYVIDSVLKR